MSSAVVAVPNSALDNIPEDFKEYCNQLAHALVYGAERIAFYDMDWLREQPDKDDAVLKMAALICREMEVASEEACGFLLSYIPSVTIEISSSKYIIAFALAYRGYNGEGAVDVGLEETLASIGSMKLDINARSMKMGIGETAGEQLERVCEKEGYTAVERPGNITGEEYYHIIVDDGQVPCPFPFSCFHFFFALRVHFHNLDFFSACSNSPICRALTTSRRRRSSGRYTGTCLPVSRYEGHICVNRSFY
jgi:hypothetical protein